MTDIIETTQTDFENPEEEEKQEYSGRKIMCFVSKQMVPIEDTIEVEYAVGKSYRVLSHYVRFEQES